MNVDVWAEDHSSPPHVIAVECKHWSSRAPKNVVHGFRTVVGDSGANTGLIVSSAGFQKGAFEAAEYSNVRVVTWEEFQTTFAERWFVHFMAPRLDQGAETLHQYTEPINSWVSQEAEDFSPEELARFRELRDEYLPLSQVLMYMSPGAQVFLRRPGQSVIPEPPLRDGPYTSGIPDDVLDATSLRP